MKCSFCGIDAGISNGKCVKCGYDIKNKAPSMNSYQHPLLKLLDSSVNPEVRKDLMSAFLEQRSQPIKRLEINSRYKGNPEEETRKRTADLYNTEAENIAEAKRKGVQYQSGMGKMLYTEIPGMSTLLKGAAASMFLPIAIFVKERMLVEED